MASRSSTPSVSATCAKPAASVAASRRGRSSAAGALKSPIAAAGQGPSMSSTGLASAAPLSSAQVVRTSNAVPTRVATACAEPLRARHIRLLSVWP